MSQVAGYVREAVAVRLGLTPGAGTQYVRCAYCKAIGMLWWPTKRDGSPSRYIGSTLEWDHVLPRAAGGTDDADNITLACKPCNRSKKDRTVEQWLGRQVG